MATFFKDFPLVNYRFGNETDTALFQNITTYISILDALRDDVSFYNDYFIGEGERPDIVSQRLYGHVGFYWTFYYLNNHIRESGWPLSIQELYKRVKVDYPNEVITTADNIAVEDGGLNTTAFAVGSSVGGTWSGATGKIIKKNLDMGQLVIRKTTPNQEFKDNNSAGVTSSLFERIKGDNDQYARSVVAVEQYNAIHHYEDADGVWQFLTPNTDGGVSLTTGADWLPVTYWDRYEAKNNALRQIKILTPNVAAQVQAEFNKLLRRG